MKPLSKKVHPYSILSDWVNNGWVSRILYVTTVSHSISGQEIEEVLVDDCGDGEAAAEGAHLALWSYDALKAKKETLKALNIKPLSQEDDTTLWSSGVKKAKGQNFARTLMETPANYMTPTLFAQVCMIFIISKL